VAHGIGEALVIMLRKFTKVETYESGVVHIVSMTPRTLAAIDLPTFGSELGKALGVIARACPTNAAGDQ
jgi:hypothetical protein